MAVGRALVWIVAVLLWACTTGQVIRDGQRVSYEEAAHRDLAQARRHLADGELSEGRAVLERLLRELDRSRRTDEARFLLGEVVRRQGASETAAAIWSDLVEQDPSSAFASEAALRAARVYRELGRPESARRLLERTPLPPADEDLGMRILLLRAELAAEVGDAADAVIALSLAREGALDEPRRAEIDRRLDALIGPNLSDSVAASLADELPAGSVRDRVLLSLARRSLSRGNPAAALEALGRLASRPSPGIDEERRILEERALRGFEPGAKTLGLALPLSGPYRPFGERALRSVVLALGLFERSEARFRVLIGDTRGEVARAPEVIADLVERGADAIIGPLRSPVALAAAPVSESGGVPLLTLARHRDVSKMGDFVFRIGLSSSDEARTLARHFVSQTDLERFAVLYPDDAYGREFKNEFWEAVEAEGADIVGVEKYEPSAVDWQDPIRKLVGLHPAYLDERQKELLSERERLMRRPLENAERLADPELAELPPYIDFEALFIPDAAEKVGLILPQLRFFDVEYVVFLGPSSWNNPALVEIAGRHAKGVVFTSDFCAPELLPPIESFVERHRTTYGSDPDSIAARAFDAARLVELYLESGGRPAREQLRQRLLATRDFGGVSGLESFDARGSSVHQLCLLTVQRGAIRPFEGRP